MTLIKNDKMRQTAYTESTRVEQLQAGDVEEIIVMARLMHKTSPIYSRFPFCDAVFRGWLTAAVNEPNRYFCGVAKRGDEVIGALLGAAMNMLFSDKKMASELGLYVYDKYRGGRAGLLILLAFADWAKKQGCSLITVGVSAGITDERAVRFYERLGFEKHGVLLRREIG